MATPARGDGVAEPVSLRIPGDDFVLRAGFGGHPPRGGAAAPSRTVAHRSGPR